MIDQFIENLGVNALRWRVNLKHNDVAYRCVLVSLEKSIFYVTHVDESLWDIRFPILFQLLICSFRGAFLARLRTFSY